MITDSPAVTDATDADNDDVADNCNAVDTMLFPIDEATADDRDGGVVANVVDDDSDEDDDDDIKSSELRREPTPFVVRTAPV